MEFQMILKRLDDEKGMPAVRQVEGAATGGARECRRVLAAGVA